MPQICDSRSIYMHKINLRGEVGIVMTIGQLHMILTICNHARENAAVIVEFRVVSGLY